LNGFSDSVYHDEGGNDYDDAKQACNAVEGVLLVICAGEKIDEGVNGLPSKLLADASEEYKHFSVVLLDFVRILQISAIDFEHLPVYRCIKYQGGNADDCKLSHIADL